MHADPVALLPCPFCGSDNLSVVEWIECNNCGTIGAHDFPGLHAEGSAQSIGITAWNTRTPAPAGDVLAEWMLLPFGDPVSLNECPPGPFEFNGGLGFKTEYGAAKWLPERDAFTVSHWPDPYCLDSGEAFWGGVSEQEARAALIVQPLASTTTDSAVSGPAEGGVLPIADAPLDGTPIIVPTGHGMFNVVTYWGGGWRETANGLLLRNQPTVFAHIPAALTEGQQS